MAALWIGGSHNDVNPTSANAGSSLLLMRFRSRVIFFFPPYQLAAYAAGPQTISLPLSQIAGVLAPAYIPAS